MYDSLRPRVADQAPLSMEFSRQNTGVGCHFLNKVLTNQSPMDGHYEMDPFVKLCQ